MFDLKSHRSLSEIVRFETATYLTWNNIMHQKTDKESIRNLFYHDKALTSNIYSKGTKTLQTTLPNIADDQENIASFSIDRFLKCSNREALPKRRCSRPGVSQVLLSYTPQIQPSGLHQHIDGHHN